MIQFSRQIARQLRVVLRKMFGRIRPDVRLIAGPDGLRFQAKGEFHAVEYHDPEARAAEQLVVPNALLADVQGTKKEPVRLYLLKQLLTASWEDRGVERTMQYALPTDDGTVFHSSPSEFIDNPATLITALRDAALCTDKSSSRYALGCLQWRGQFGQVAATDGKQLLIQSGYSFGFQDEVLVHSTEVFGFAELPQDQPVQIGKTDTHVVVRLGPWSFYLTIQKEGRFPRVTDIIPSIHSAQTTVELHPADAQFLAENVSRLPGNAESQDATLDCNGTIAVRAKTAESQPTEIILTNSTKSGSDVSICLDRRNLARAATMGFDRIYLYGKQSAVLARDETRSFLFMPLHEQNGIKPSDDGLKIPSPVSTGSPYSRRSHPRHYIPTPTMPTNRINQVTTTPASTSPGTAVHDASNADTNQSPRRCRSKSATSGTVLDQAVSVRDQLRTTLTGVKQLIRTLKSERRSQKSLKVALDSLKQLQHAV